MSNYYAYDLDSFRYISHHGILGQKWGVRRYQNPDGTRTAAGKKRYSWLQDKLGYDERDKRNVAYAKATYEGFKANAALKQKREAQEKASKSMDDSLNTARNLRWAHENLRGHNFNRGFELGIKEYNAWNNYNANPTQDNLKAALEISDLIESEIEDERFFKEMIKNGENYLSFISKNKKKEIDDYLAASNRYASATTAEQKAKAELKSANDAYNKTVLGRIESGKKKVKEIFSKLKRKR